MTVKAKGAKPVKAWAVLYDGEMGRFFVIGAGLFAKKRHLEDWFSRNYGRSLTNDDRFYRAVLVTPLGSKP